ncbi:MAG: HD domain-containing protein [bacterium]
MAKVYVRDLVCGQKAQALFVLAKKDLRKTKNGDPYLLVTLADKTGTISGNMWWAAGVEQLWDTLGQGDLVDVKVAVEEYKGQKQVKIEDISCYNGLYDAGDFIASVENRKALLEELRRIISTVKTSYLFKLLQLYFDDPVFVEGFSTAPAAKNWHDNKIGGLLKHTLNLTKICISVANQYPDFSIDRDLLIAAAILHDSGKIREYSTEGVSIGKTTEGLLVGHTNIALLDVAKKIDTIADFPKGNRDHLLHLIISHHGQYEFGAAVLPATVEAAILHSADVLESMMVGIAQQRETSKEEWVYSKVLNRYLYLGNVLVEEEESTGGVGQGLLI